VTNAVAAIQGNRKWIYNSDLGLCEVYDLHGDPRELHNLSGAGSDECADGRELLWVYEFAERTLPGLKAEGIGALDRWLHDWAIAEPAPPLVARWAALEVVRATGITPELRARLEAILASERTPAVRLAILSLLEKSGLTIEEAGVSVEDSGELGLIRFPGVLKWREPDLRRLLESRFAAVRTAAAAQLAALPTFAATARAAVLTHPDAPTRRGLMRGLARTPGAVDAHLLGTLASDRDADIRASALEGLRTVQGAAAVLQQRFKIERSPTALTAILNHLLSLDRNAGMTLLRQEIGSPRLSDYARATLIAENQVAEHAGHLADLFDRTESVAFRNDLFRMITAMGLPQPDVERLLMRMRQRAFEPQLRNRIDRHLRGRPSKLPGDQDDKAGAARER
jgi:hypothetical protein